jgi:hypothetical protein
MTTIQARLTVEEIKDLSPLDAELRMLPVKESQARWLGQMWDIAYKHKDSPTHSSRVGIRLRCPDARTSRGLTRHGPPLDRWRTRRRRAMDEATLLPP